MHDPLSALAAAEDVIERRHDGWPLCECGCGEPAPQASRNDRRQGVRKGDPIRFIRGHNRRLLYPRDPVTGARACKTCGVTFIPAPTWDGRWQTACPACRRQAEQKYKRPRRPPEYAVWGAMIQRCTNPNNKMHPYYGGRGIRVCDRWQASFANFMADVGPRPSDKHSIDRIDNDGHYEPGNVRWALVSEQARNRSDNRMYSAFGKTMCAQDWAAEIGINCRSLIKRIEVLGWPIERALSEPPHEKFRPKSKPRRGALTGAAVAQIADAT